MTGDFGECANLKCDRPATRVLFYEGTDRTTGEHVVRERHLCDEHYADLTRPCGNDSCRNIATHVIPITRSDNVEDELPVCRDCAEAFTQARALTINGVRMIKHASRLKALPEKGGHG